MDPNFLLTIPRISLKPSIFSIQLASRKNTTAKPMTAKGAKARRVTRSHPDISVAEFG
ncbi:MAG: hypothetical protein WAL87_04860 [Chthoniobacterales bacterium]